MSEQDWADRKAQDIWNQCEDFWGLIGDNTSREGNKLEMLEIISKALREVKKDSIDPIPKSNSERTE